MAGNSLPSPELIEHSDIPAVVFDRGDITLVMARRPPVS